MRRYEKNLRQNTNSSTDYIDGLFRRYARLLVLRVDFSYRNQNRYSITEKEIHEDYPQTKIDREHFFRNMRSNTLFDHLLGYVWKLEYGLNKGFHYHLIFFYDGSKVQQDINRAKMIGEYWQTTITQGRGIYFNCNAKQDQYKYPGIGIVNYYDDKLRVNLIKAATYLTKSDYYASVIVLGEGRTFGKGQIKHKTSNRRGRPRKFVEYSSKHRQHGQLTRETMKESRIAYSSQL